MSRSNRGLNEPFYKWIDDVRRAMRKEKELQEKLEFYNMKLIGYKGVSYDRIGSSGSRSSGDSELLYWIEKIDQIEKAKIINYVVIKGYEDFLTLITPLEQKFIVLYIQNCIFQNMSKHECNSTKTRITHKWFLNNKTCYFEIDTKSIDNGV